MYKTITVTTQTYQLIDLLAVKHNMPKTKILDRAVRSIAAAPKLTKAVQKPQTPASLLKQVIADEKKSGRFLSKNLKIKNLLHEIDHGSLDFDKDYLATK